MKKSDIARKMAKCHNSALKEDDLGKKGSLFGQAHAYADIMDVMNQEAGLSSGEAGEVSMVVEWKTVVGLDKARLIKKLEILKEKILEAVSDDHDARCVVESEIKELQREVRMSL